METSVVAGVETAVECDSSGRARAASLHVQLLGPLTIRRNGVAVALPTSRKVRALLAYLALAPRAAGRSQLCDLLWDVPNDPRAELRWCLSKLRGVLDAPRVDQDQDADVQSAGFQRGDDRAELVVAAAIAVQRTHLRSA